MLRTFVFFIVLIFTSFFLTNSSYAVEVKELYQAKVAVKNQSSVIRSQAIKQAMAAVLVKISGQKDIVRHEAFQNPLNIAQQYLVQFHYDKFEDQLLLVVDFDDAKIDSLFKNNNIAIWGSLRPKVLLWLVNEQGLIREITSSFSENQLTQKFFSYSQQRGLPLYFPLMDLEDSTTINVADLWGRFVEPVNLASTRYQPEKIVIVRISDSSLIEESVTVENDNQHDDCGLLCVENIKDQKEIVIDWSIIENYQTISQPYKGSNVEKLIEVVVDDIIKHIYQQYAFQTGNQQKLVLEVSNVDGLEKLVAIIDFFENLSSIESVSLLYVNGIKYRFELNVTGSPDSLLSSLTLSKQLSEVKDPLSDPFLKKVPEFLWQSK